MKNKSIKRVMLGVTCLAVALASGVFVLNHTKEEKKEKSIIEVYEGSGLTYKGKLYDYNENLCTILFMGVDKSKTMLTEQVGNGGQADTLILDILDQEKKTYQFVMISRDSMVDIETYDVQGNKLGTEHAQLALQYAYGDGEKRSCQLTKKAVLKLLYEVPIHSYVALTMEGFAKMTDALGGVEMTMPEDMTSLHPSFQEGERVLMTGGMAEAYVRMRDTEVVGSNSDRMKRQEHFLMALIQTMQKKFQEAPNGWKALYQQMEPYMETDLQVDEMKRMAEYKQCEKIMSLPGHVQRGK